MKTSIVLPLLALLAMGGSRLALAQQGQPEKTTPLNVAGTFSI